MMAFVGYHGVGQDVDLPVEMSVGPPRCNGTSAEASSDCYHFVATTFFVCFARFSFGIDGIKKIHVELLQKIGKK